jgi:hypothetical protein
MDLNSFCTVLQRLNARVSTLEGVFAPLAAPVPDVEYDAVQREFFATPEVLEKRFQDIHGKIINSRCIKELNAVLYLMYKEFNKPELAHHKYYDKTIQLLEFTVSFDFEASTQQHILTLHEIFVRPCFMGQGVLTIWMYQLLSLACHLGYVNKIVVESCTPATVNILLHKFGGEEFVFLDKDINKKPNCTLYDLDKMKEKFTAETLGIASKIKSERDGLITLREEAFPTSEQLNDPQWVHDSFKKRRSAPAPT